MMEWCKLWAEWGSDPKVQIMPEHMRCRHALLLTLRCAHDTCKLAETEIAFYMRISMDDLRETKELFIKQGFIDKHWKVLKWEKRQDYVSPAARRMRKMREHERNELRNSDETGCATGDANVAQPKRRREEKREEEKRKEKAPASPFVLPDWVPLEDWDAFIAMRVAKRAKPTEHAKDLLVRELAKLKAAGDDPRLVLQKSTRSNWTDLWPLNGTNGHPAAPAKSEKTPEQQAAERAEAMAEKTRRHEAEHARWIARQEAESKAANEPPRPKPTVPDMRPTMRPPMTQDELRKQVADMKAKEAKNG